MAEAKIIIYGAKSIALGIGEAVRKLYPENPPLCFLVGRSEERRVGKEC